MWWPASVRFGWKADTQERSCSDSFSAAKNEVNHRCEVTDKERSQEDCWVAVGVL
jgi:hypothetical protein